MCRTSKKGREGVLPMREGGPAMLLRGGRLGGKGLEKGRGDETKLTYFFEGLLKSRVSSLDDPRSSNCA